MDVRPSSSAGVSLAQAPRGGLVPLLVVGTGTKGNKEPQEPGSGADFCQAKLIVPKDLIPHPSEGLVQGLSVLVVFRGR